MKNKNSPKNEKEEEEEEEEKNNILCVGKLCIKQKKKLNIYSKRIKIRRVKNKRR